MADLRNIDVLTSTEAAERLPLLQRVAEDLKRAWGRRRRIKKRLRRFRRAVARQRSAELLETVENLEHEDRHIDDEISELEQEIHQMGGIIKDPGRGVVNFFSERDGTLIFLSWKLGEEDVSYWHEIDGEFAERRLLP